MAVQLGKRTIIKLPVRDGTRMLLIPTPAARYGPFWAITHEDQRLVHIPSGLELKPADFKLSWGIREKRRAARLLAAQGEIWNFDRSVASDGLHPVTARALEHWLKVERIVCKRGKE